MNVKHYFVFWNTEDHKRLLYWWSLLKNNPGWRAELRRAELPADVLLTQGFRYLCKELGGFWTQEKNLLALATVAGVISHVDENRNDKHFAAQLADRRESSGNPVMSELRFAQLQKSRTIDEFFIRMVRAVKLLQGNANIISVADSIFHWVKEMVDGEIDENPRNHLCVRWGIEYFHHITAPANKQENLIINERKEKL